MMQCLSSEVTSVVSYWIALFHWKHWLLELEEAIEILYPPLLFNKWRKKEDISFSFSKNRPQTRIWRASSFERFSPEIPAGKWASGIAQKRKPVKVHFQEIYCCGHLELSPLRGLRETVHTLSYPIQRADELGYLPSNLPPSILDEGLFPGSVNPPAFPSQSVGGPSLF